MIKVEKLVYGGKGLGSLNDKKCFIPYVIPDEIVEVEIKKEKKNFAECSLKNILKKSPYRVEPPCKYFTYCGGCDYLHIQYDKQLELKKEILIETLNRIGKLNVNDINEVIPSENQFFYRNRAQFKIWGEKVGFFKKESNEVINIDSCLIVNEDINLTLSGIKEILKYLKFQPIEAHVFSTSLGEKTVKLIFPRKQKRFPLGLKHLRAFLGKNLKGVGIFHLSKKGHEKDLILGNGFAYEQVLDYKFRVSINSFFQINRYQIKNLISVVEENLSNQKYNRGLDLFSGVGTLTIPAGKYVEKIVGLESNPYAVQDGNHNKKINGRKNIEFLRADVKDSAKLISEIDPDLMIIDPPRTGIPDNIINKIKDLNSLKKIIYVSCDPSTLARDLKLLREKFEISKIYMIDMFPQTYHIETVVILSK